MGQKVNPHGLRVGVIKDWDSKWYADGDFADYLVEDYNIRTFLKKKLYAAGVSKIEIERASDRVKVIIYTAKPGVVIGKGGAEIEKIKAEVHRRIRHGHPPGSSKATRSVPVKRQLSKARSTALTSCRRGESFIPLILRYRIPEKRHLPAYQRR